MKVWTTKHALTAGIEEAEVEIEGDMAIDRAGRFPQFFHGEGRQWHRTHDAAVKRANAMRDAKLDSIAKQVKRLKAMSFEEASPRPTSRSPAASPSPHQE